jgi:hypothetical protein
LSPISKNIIKESHSGPGNRDYILEAFMNDETEKIHTSRFYMAMCDMELF